MFKNSLLYIILGSICFAGCQLSGSKEQQAQRNTPVSDTEACFLHVEGASSQDSTLIHIILQGDRVRGSMAWLPAEKDARRGTIKGTKHQDTLELAWVYMQEGSKDSLSTRFLWQGDTLKQQELAVDSQTGQQYTPESGNFSLIYQRITCEPES